MNKGRLCLDELNNCGTHVGPLLIISVTLEVTMFHLSLTVMLSFRTLLMCKVVQVFQNTSIVRFISKEHFAFRATFAFG